MIPINPQTNRLDQLRATSPPMGGPPMGGSPMGGPPMGGPPMGGPPMGGMPTGGSPTEGIPMNVSAGEGSADTDRIGALLSGLGGDEALVAAEEEEAPTNVSSGLVEAAVSLTGSVSAARIELEMALAEIDAMEMELLGSGEEMMI